MRRRAPAILFLLMSSGVALGLPGEPEAGPAGDTAALEALGQAYATAWGLGFVKVETSRTATVAADHAKYTDELEKALAIGYAPEEGVFLAVPLATLKDVLKIEMAGNRTPAEVVKAIAIPGNRVVNATWYFAGSKPVTSSAVFSPGGEVLFDTLLFLPVLKGPVLEPGP
jgi:hypothetical protein